MNNFFKELKRRNVFKETIAFLVVAWLVLQILSVILPIWNAPVWILQIVTITLAIGLPLWILFSWTYEFTTSGIKKTTAASSETSENVKTSRRFNAIIMIALIAVIALIWINPSFVTSKTPALRQGIAVLPFTNMSADADNEWFGDGVTEDILTHLSKIKGLRVISHTSVKRYKNSDKSIPEIAKELGVTYVVEGSVRQLNNKVLITAQLISATDEHLWADNYDDDLDNAFEVQRNVAKEIVKQLQITISPEEEQALNVSLTNNQEALQLYVKGRDMSDVSELTGETSIRNSIEVFKQAIELDPNFASAYAEIANSIFVLSGLHIPLDEGEKESKEWITKALEIDPNNARAYGVLGAFKAWRIYIGESTPEMIIEAKLAFEKSIELNPNDARVRHHYGQYFMAKPEQDVENFLIQLEEANKLEPFSFLVKYTYLQALIANQKYDEAYAVYQEKLYLFDGEQGMEYNSSILISWHKKDWNEAIKVWQKAVKDYPETAAYYAELGEYYAEVLNDWTNHGKYAKKAFDLYNYFEYAENYFNSIYGSGNRERAMNLLDTELAGAISPKSLNWFQNKYYYDSGAYKEAIEGLDKFPMNENSYTLKYLCYVKLEEQELADEIMSKYIESGISKITIYADLKERDSLYHYLDKLNFEEAKDINTQVPKLGEFRSESRYKSFLTKNYLPVLTEE